MHLRRLSVPTRAALRDGQAAHSEKRIWILLAASCVLFAQRHLCHHELHCTFAAPMMRIQEAYRQLPSRCYTFLALEQRFHVR